MRKVKTAVVLVLMGIGVAGSLTGCFVEEGHGDGWHHHDWR
jgi:hypothetical protein